MVVINCAYSEHINPPGASPVLTQKQIWNGLQRKVRRAQDFVPVIKGYDVIEDNGNTVVREAHFEAVHGNPAKVRWEYALNQERMNTNGVIADGS